MPPSAGLAASRSRTALPGAVRTRALRRWALPQGANRQGNDGQVHVLLRLCAALGYLGHVQLVHAIAQV